MATVLDISILSNLSIIFIFVAAFVGSWGLMNLIDPFGLKDDKKKKIYAILSFSLSFLLIMSPKVLGIIAFSIPWFSLIILIAFFLLFFSKMFDPGLDTGNLIRRAEVWGFLLFFAALAVIFGFANSVGQDLLEQQPGISDADRITGETYPSDSFVPADQVVGSQSAEVIAYREGTTASGDIGSNIILTIFHPKILGMLFMMLLGTITILLIAR